MKIINQEPLYVHNGAKPVGVLMFGHDDHKDNDEQATPEVHVNEALLTPDNFEPTEPNNDHAAAVDDAPDGIQQITPSAPATDDAPVAAAPPVVTGSSASADPNDPLLSIKRDALQSLSPLLGHLDQTPEEKFRTTMMLIQATDNKDLLSDAYTAAKTISDEKVRAQALLDVVNEINYFTAQAKK